jgi:molecular chaperone IbpA
MAATQLVTFDDLFKFAFGFDRVFNELDRVARLHSSGGYPPYNIITDNPKRPTQYVVELAVAGFSRDELKVTVAEHGGVRTLNISGEKAATAGAEDDAAYLVKMLATRKFSRQFTLADDAEVDGVELRDGVLRVTVKIRQEDPNERVRVLQIT